MEQKPKERIVFDEWPYYGSEGEEVAIDDLMARDDLTEDEVRESYTESEIFEHQMELRKLDYEEEIAALTDYFDGEPSVMSSVVSENAGNPVIVSGTVGRWDGTRSGLTVYKCFEDALDTSPSSTTTTRSRRASFTPSSSVTSWPSAMTQRPARTVTLLTARLRP